MNSRSRIQKTTQESSDHLTASIQPRPFSALNYDQSQPVRQDFSHVDLFSHDPGPRSVPNILQAKLTIGQPGDKYEQEADRVAAQVVSQIDAPQPPPRSAQGEDVQREALEGDEELQMKPEVAAIQRQLDTTAANYIAVQNQYPDAATALEQCHNAAQALRQVAVAQNQPWNYVWAWCTKPGDIFAMDHVALESGGVVYDLTLQQFPGIPAGPWIGTVGQWQTTVRRAYKTKMRQDGENGQFTVSFEQSQERHFNDLTAPPGATVLGVFNSPAPKKCTIL